MSAADTGRAFLDEALLTFRKQKKLAEKAMAQVDDEAFFRLLDPEANSLALLVKHVAGNQRSRWTDFLTTDGEKPDRDRDTEFELDGANSRAELMARWDAGWELVFAAIEPLGPEDLARTVTIRGEPHSVLQAIQRQIAHYAQHVGQIVLLAKHWSGPAWQSLSIPRGKSREYATAHGVAKYRPKS